MGSDRSWEGIKVGEGIKETALKNENLNADIRVSDEAVEVNAPSMWQRFKVAMGLEKAPVYASREETLTNLREQFGLNFSQKLRSLIQETGIKTDSEEYKTLVTHAMQSFEVITQKLTTAIATPTVSTSQAIQEAHKGALSSLALLRQLFSTPQLTPQFCKTKDGKWSVLQPAPHPENAALSGGGVKGAGYVGWFKAAEQFGVLKNLKRIAGSSAGAVTAALIASGMSAEDFKKASDRTSFWSLLTGTSQDSVINAATKLETKGWLSYFSFSGTYAVDHINQEMVGSIKKYFNEFKTEAAFKEKIEELQSSTSISQEDAKRLVTLYQKIVPPPSHWLFGSFFQKKQSTYMVTFQDLALLTKSDSRFKELTVTAYSTTENKEEYFNAKTTPEVKIAEAVRASMALPVAFSPVIIHSEKIEDGGVGSNTPAEVFKEYPQSTTLVLQFENDGRFNEIVYGVEPKQKPLGVVAKEEQQFKEALEEAVTQNRNLEQDFKKDEGKLFEAGPNAMMVGKGSLGAISFTATAQEIRQAELQAEIRAMEAFSLRQNQAIDHIFESLKDAMKMMSAAELRSIIAFYDLKPPQYDTDYEEKERQGVDLPLSKKSRRMISEILSKEDRTDIVEAAKKSLEILVQPELSLQ